MNSTATIPDAQTPRLSPQAVLALGLAAISLPFSHSPEEEVDRWLRILRLRGRTGRVLQAIGVGESSVAEAKQHGAQGNRRRSSDAIVDRVSASAVAACRARQAAAVETEDILTALLVVYGRLFEEALEAHGTSSQEVQARLVLAR